MSILIFVFLLLLSLVLSFLFSGYETGFVSVNPIRIRHLAAEEGVAPAGRLQRHLDAPNRLLTALLIGNNLAMVVSTVLITRALLANEFTARYNEVIATAIVTPLLLIFAEIIPKSVFRVHPNRLTVTLLPAVEFFHYLFLPFSWPIAALTQVLARWLGADSQGRTILMRSVEDVRSLVDESAKEGTLEREAQRMIHSVIDLHSRQAKEIMKPRIDMYALPDTATREELVAMLQQSGKTRIPIYHETIDEVLGVAISHDLLQDPEPENPEIGRFVREVRHVPDTMKVDDLFALMKDSKQHLVIVTDEYGGTDGLITLEDILEEIFGEIQDEHDQEELGIMRVGRNTFVVDARCSLEDLSEAIDAPIEDEEVETVGGWVMRLAGRIPEEGDVFESGRFRVKVLEAGENHIVRVRLEVADPPEEDDAESE